MRTYGQFCPVAQALELLGERWTLLVVRELLCGSTRFVDLSRGLPRISKSVLSARLHSLQAAGLVERAEDPADRSVRWRPTPACLALLPLIETMGVWSQVHLRRPVAVGELDAGLLMWDIRRNVIAEQLGEAPVTVKFHIRDAPTHQRTFWLLRREDGIELCLEAPPVDPDASVWSDLATLTDVWIGRRDLEEALRSGALRVEGGSVAARFTSWIGLSTFAGHGAVEAGIRAV